MGPLEAGILYVRAERIGEVWPSIVTAGWSDHLDGALKLEVFGQQDDPRFAGIDAALDFVNLIGMKNIEARVRSLATYFKEQIHALPVQLKTNMEADLSHGVVKFRPARARSGSITTRCGREIASRSRKPIPAKRAGCAFRTHLQHKR